MCRLKSKCMDVVYSLLQVKTVRNRLRPKRMLANITNSLAYTQVNMWAKTADTNGLICYKTRDSCKISYS